MNLQKHGGTGAIELSDAIFAQKRNDALIHQAVVADMSRNRVGKANKSRSQVSGSGRKPWRQKGTGSARVGTRRNPIWRGGGVAFAATADKRELKINRKMFRAALRSLLSYLCANGRLLVGDELKVSSPKTREMVAWLKERELNDVLIVVPEIDDNLALATRNMRGLEVIEASQVDALTLLRFDKVWMAESAVRKLEERLA